MKKLTILSISSIILLVLSMGLADAGSKYKKDITTINPEFMMTPDEGREWHVFKALLGPTYAGSPSGIKYTQFIEAKLREFGVVDIIKNAWTYNRYFVNDWLIHEGPLRLISDGTPVAVATFGMLSGFTGPGGITAQMVYYDSTMGPPAPGAWAGKIVVMKTTPNPPPLPFSQSYISGYTVTDSEYVSSFTSGQPAKELYWPLFQYVPPSVTNSFNGRWNWSQIGTFRSYAITGQAVGMVVVYDLPWETAEGLYQRTEEYNCPTLCLDRVSGVKVVEDAKSGKMATLTLLAEFIPSETYNFIGYLPGKNYGTDKDEQVNIACHTDAMSLTQDNGCLGVLGVVKYFSHIPQSERPRSLNIYVDCRHFMPGAESRWAAEDILMQSPELLKPIVAMMGFEHMGELEGIELDDLLMPSGNVQTSFIGMGARQANNFIIDTIIKAIKDNNWPRAEIKCQARPGIRGGFQASPRTAMFLGTRFNKPGIGLAGDWPGYHTQTFAGIERFSKDLFFAQVASMAQIAGAFMVVAPVVIDYVWSDLQVAIRNLPDDAFKQPALASNYREALLDEYNKIFKQVRDGAYNGAINTLEKNLEKEIMQWVVQADQPPLIALIDLAIEKLMAAK